jgi:N4-gp56 family major capsid protein
MAISTLGSAITARVNRVAQTAMLSQARELCPYYKGSLPGRIDHHANSLTIHWRRLDDIAPSTSAITELSGTATFPTRVATALAITDTTATLSKYGDFAYLTEEVELVNPTSDDMEILLGFARAGGRSLNRLQRNILEDNLTPIYASGAVADSGVTDIISVNLIQQGTNALDRASANMFTAMTRGDAAFNTSPTPAAYWGFCHSDVAEDIRFLAGFIPIEKYAGQTAVAAGEIGTVGRVRWISTPEASIDTDSGGAAGPLRTTTGVNADLYASVIIGMECHGSVGFGIEHVQETYKAGDSLPALMIIQKARGSAGAADPLDELSTIGYKFWHTGAILNSTWGRVIRTGATRLT